MVCGGLPRKNPDAPPWYFVTYRWNLDTVVASPPLKKQKKGWHPLEKPAEVVTGTGSDHKLDKRDAQS